ncbi:MAG: hypothetical protein Q7U82_09695 [Gammaproteobacteria bacterium]|nr:hypothetical protein [Gammaproteobacteria bacterium]
MNRATALSLRRQALCLRLQAQRRALQLQVLAAAPMADDDYPRSFTMRLLTQQPSLAILLATEILPLLLNRFLGKSACRKRLW